MHDERWWLTCSISAGLYTFLSIWQYLSSIVPVIAVLQGEQCLRASEIPSCVKLTPRRICQNLRGSHYTSILELNSRMVSLKGALSVPKLAVNVIVTMQYAPENAVDPTDSM